jgi:hypothetical protein
MSMAFSFLPHEIEGKLHSGTRHLDAPVLQHLWVDLAHDTDFLSLDADLRGPARNKSGVLQGNQLRIQGQIIKESEKVRIHFVETGLPVSD